MPTTRSPRFDSPDTGTALVEFVEFAERSAVRCTTAISLHAHTNRSREGVAMLPGYLDRIPVVGQLTRRELQAYERRHQRPVDLRRAWWQPPVRPEDVLASERSQILNRLGLRPIVSITDHDTIEAPVLLQAVRDPDVPLSVEWTVPFGRGFLHLGVHNLPRGTGQEMFRDLSAYTHDGNERRLRPLLDRLHEHPGILVVLNHPIWDLAGVGIDEHAALLHRFLAEHGARIHAVEVNGYRSRAENAAAIEVARAAVLPVVSGGDRHGRAPNALLNLTSAASFAEFASEIREARRSVVLVMPEYWQPLVSRKLAVASDALREYPAYPAGERHWTDRVTYEQGDGVRRLSEQWPGGGPFWVRSATRLFAIATADPLRPVLRLAVWMADASMSARTPPNIATGDRRTLPSGTSVPETIA
jgi:hypothetical protein